MVNQYLTGRISRILLLSALSTLTVSFATTSATAKDKVVKVQERNIKGKVSDQGGGTLPGVSITVKGTTTGTTTDSNGEFTIKVPNEKSVLVVSYVGYLTQEITVGNQNSITVVMQEDTKTLEEVVVVGYGEQRKETLTGSVVSVDDKVFKNRGPIANPMQALQGQVPGVVVTRNSAQPGRENWNFQVRGASSTNNTEPLIIIDGVPVPQANALNSINPNDIDNISFLKDAAASIYGSRAAGGVVLITTKRAKSGKPTIEYSTAFSQKVLGLQPKLLTVDEWWPFIREARTNDGFAQTDLWLNLTNVMEKALKDNKTVITPAEYVAYGTPGAALFGDVRDFPFFRESMQDILWGNANSMEHQLSVSSRTDKAGYRISLGYLNDGSLLQYGNNSNKRYNFRLTHDYNFSSKLKMGTNLSLERNDIIQPTLLGNVLNNGIQQGLPAFNAKGDAYLWGSGIQNASQASIAKFGGDNKELNTRINVNTNLSYEVIPSLKLVGTVGYYLLNTDYRTFENNIPFYNYDGSLLLSTLPTRSSYQRANKQEAYYNASAYAEYAKKFNSIHDFRLTAGLQYERNEYNRFFSRTLDVVPNVPNSLSLSTGDPTTKTIGEAQNHYAIGGYFSRLNYSLNDKYLFEANFRYDGSSKFDADNRWQGFYGASVGWRIKQESFLRDVKAIDELKLRLSYGKVGNQNGIGLYDYIQFLNLNFSPGATSSGFPILGSSPVVRVAPNGTLVALDRTWETVINQNIGLDFAFLNNRLVGSFDAYIKNNNNMLISRTYSSLLGANAPDGNNGVLQTKGWESALQWRDKIGSFNYRIGGNISDNNNNLVSFGGQTIISSANRGLNSGVEGHPINSYFGLVYDGRIQSQEQLDAYRKFITGNNIGIPSGAATAQANARLAIGDNMYKDINGDGRITFPEDAVNLGSDNPRYIYSFNGGFDWKGFDFNVIFQGVAKRELIRDGNWRLPAQTIFQAQNAAFLGQTWSSTNTDAYYPRLSTTGTINNYNYFPSSFVVENAAYIRLKNLVVGYTIPSALTQRLHISRLRVYFSGSDLWERSKIKDGWDPEATRSVANTGDAENNNVSTFSQRFPFYRYMTFGLNLTF
ncbi:MAG: SusC/RagA family TonB-linked outer membrane protein [Emticicia sp.]|uniref:SusC/RagA family TonB-linked outer membrane protein n=1 Tax=Emticicia sp. TaxID=1930953 RepID=UPI003BA7CF56